MISDHDFDEGSQRCFEKGPVRNFKTVQRKKRTYKMVRASWETAKIAFYFFTPVDVHKQYITGNIPQLGFAGQVPKPMELNWKVDRYRKWECFWKYIIEVKNDLKIIHYRYGMQQKKGDNLIWEREPNRVCNLKNIQYCANNVYNSLNDIMGVAQKETLLMKNKNNKYLREDANFTYYFFYTQVTDNLWLGPYLQIEEEYSKLNSEGVCAIQNLQTDEDLKSLKMTHEDLERNAHEKSMYYENYQINDNDQRDFNMKCLGGVEKLNELVQNYDKVYVHCTAGVHRSPKLICLYLMQYGNLGIKEAIDLVIAKRPQAKVSVKIMNSILNYCDWKRGSNRSVNKCIRYSNKDHKN